MMESTESYAAALLRDETDLSRLENEESQVSST
jgi:hypothetical protein